MLRLEARGEGGVKTVGRNKNGLPPQKSRNQEQKSQEQGQEVSRRTIKNNIPALPKQQGDRYFFPEPAANRK
eukprot:scaffold1290_cov112-Skeletonema_dohrnii-CCMP3373.AAC.2